MVETAAHLAEHVFTRLPVRQWVFSVPKRLLHFLHRNAVVQGAVLRIFLREHSAGCSAEAPSVRWPSSTASAHP